MEDQLPAGGGGVDVLGDALEANVPVVQAGDRLDEMGEGAAEPVESPDNQSVAGADVVEGFVEAYALLLSAGCSVGEDPGAAGLLQGVFLEIKGLVCG